MLKRVAILAVALLVAGCTSSDELARDDAGLEEEAGVTWYLPDDSEFTVMTRPWPAVSGSPVLLKAQVSMGDWSESNFAGRVRYRIAGQDEEWVTMKRAGEDDYYVYFRDEVRLEQGKVGVEFNIVSDMFENPIVLSDWALEVR